MPPDLLLPAFALTLLANAVMIALAIRGLRRSRTDSAPTGDWFTSAPTARPPSDGGPGTPSFPRAPATDVDPAVDPGAAVDDAPAVAAVPVAPVPEPSTATEAVTASDPVLPAPARARASRPRSAPRPLTPSSSPAPGAEPAGRRGRRKFSLPPIDDDEKVTRSIESFLAGSDGPGQPTDATASVNTEDDRPKPTRGVRARAVATDGPGNTPTTIALIAIAGLETASDGRNDETFDTVTLLERAVRAAQGGDDEATDPVAMLERALRGAARGGDEVHRAGEGRFRIVLPATGELAARAYLRRIRASVEPQLEAADRPLHLVVATATALNVPIRTATITARRRLEAALAAHPDDPADPNHDDEPEPRAAGD